MRILFLCGYFSNVNEDEILSNSKKAVEYSANIFQKKIISGLKNKNYPFHVISAPFIGSYPNAYKKSRFQGFEKETNECEYVHFNNIWGFRNFSRARALKKAIKKFTADEDNEKIILVYSPHTPFLDAAVFAKKADKDIKICLVVPDLPQYMNLNAKKSVVYRIGKRFDIKKFNRLNRHVDSYVLLTEFMKEKIEISEKPYCVIEGIIEENELCAKNEVQEIQYEGDKKYIVYTGKMNEKFGVKNLVDAFSCIEDQNLELILCGCGDMQEYAKEKAVSDPRIRVLGQVSAKEAKEWIKKASVLVNPRQNNEEYTKYSFPSKNIEYLLSGNHVVGYMLDGMPRIYQNFIEIVPDDSIEALGQTIKTAVSERCDHKGFYRYAQEKLLCAEFINSVIEMSK